MKPHLSTLSLKARLDRLQWRRTSHICGIRSEKHHTDNVSKFNDATFHKREIKLAWPEASMLPSTEEIEERRGAFGLVQSARPNDSSTAGETPEKTE